MMAPDRQPAHVAPLNRFAAVLRARHGDVPDFDPLDGGIAARLLVLLETPGPASVSTGTTSRDNPTGTARNLTRFLDGLPLSRWDTVIWNAVPWRLPRRGGKLGRPTRMDIEAAARDLPALLALLPRVQVVVLAGRVAQSLRPALDAARPDLTVIAIPHPSPTHLAASPAARERLFGEASRREIAVAIADEAG
ncbi:uracil-DNA glycosylase family protein [Bosea massiliensis]|uniref:Uracil-DNA glycosylase family protein n=1 Tax=Bosea massiliensis TaxID=151419 RepID=A0ABW0NZQ0_9HYPH